MRPANAYEQEALNLLKLARGLEFGHERDRCIAEAQVLATLALASQVEDVQTR